MGKRSSIKLLLPLKKWLKNEGIENVIAKILSFCMKFSYATTKWTIVRDNVPAKYHKEGIPFVVGLWHDRLMMAPCVWRWENHPLHVLASSHRDGKLIAKVVARLGMPAVYGSTGKGVAAAKELIQLVRNGKYIAVIPDGPKGPRHKAAVGIVAISRLTKADILPFSCCVKRFYRFNSWDRFILAWPFNKGVMVWGDPISWTELKDMSSEDATKYVESKINECSEQAYRLLIA